MRRAAQTLRDPWGWLVAAIGGGAAWAAGLPVLGAGAIGVGMLAAASVVGAAMTSDDEEPTEELRPGTSQRRLVTNLDGYLDDIRRLRHEQPGLGIERINEAVAAASNARAVAGRVAVAVDELDEALGNAGRVAQQMSSKQAVSSSMQRMTQRREQLLAKLSGAVDGVGELYTRLLELGATTSSDHSIGDGMDPVGELNSSLDAIRSAFAELDSAAGQGRDADRGA